MAKKTPEDVTIARYAEIGRTIRWIAICILFGWCFWAITDAAVKLMDRPPWLVALLSILSCSLPFAVLLRRLLRRIRRYTKFVATRLARLEEEHDPDRTSSGLMEDGTDPPPGEDP